MCVSTFVVGMWIRKYNLLKVIYSLLFLFIFSYSAANCVLFLSPITSTSLDMSKKNKTLPENEKWVKYKLVHSAQRRMVTIVVFKISHVKYISLNFAN